MVNKFSLILILAALILISGASASLEAKDIVITGAYPSSAIFQGKFNLSLTDYPVDAMLTLEIQGMPKQEKTLREILEMNNLSYNCSPSNCISYFTSQNPASLKTVNGDKYIAAVITGTGAIAFESIQFNMIGEDIPLECYATPVTVDFLNGIYKNQWKYLKAGNDYCENYKSSDAYNDGAADYSSALYDTAYCEKIKLPMGSKFMLAADIKSGAQSMIIQMSISNSPGFNQDFSCLVDAASLPADTGNVSCEVNFKSLEEKEYDVCARIKPSTYNSNLASHFLKREILDPYGGYIGSTADKKIDFALYAKAAKFKNFNETVIFGSADYSQTKVRNYINNLTDGTKFCPADKPCILPLKVSAMQNIIFSNMQLWFFDSGVKTLETKFSDAAEEPAKLNSSGKIDLEKAEFKVPASYDRYDYTLKIGADTIRAGSISVVKLPQMTLIPSNVSASITTRFELIIDENASSYYWDFGDGIKLTTKTNFADHTYTDIGTYKVIVTAQTLRGINATKDFFVSVGTPRGFINSTLTQKSAYLRKTGQDIDALPSWYRSMASDQIGLAELAQTLQGYQAEALDPNTDLVALKNKLDGFIVYKSIKSEDIGIAPVEQITDIYLLQKAGAGEIKDEEKLSESIGKWQAYLQVTAKATVKIAESEKPDMNNDLLTVVTVEITPVDAAKRIGKTFVILSGMSYATFEDNSSQPVDGSRAFVFDSISGKKQINFAVTGRYNPADLQVITSPSFSEFLVGEFYCGNLICDKGEDYKTCPEDCKEPLTSRIIYAVLIFIAALGGIYFIWKVYVKIYENKLEKKLFKNRADLYNLTFFIGKELNKNETPENIRKKLIEAKWNPGQVDFALMKIKKERRAVQLNTLKNFISSELRMNKAEDAIKTELKTAGWQQKDIDYAYKKTAEETEKAKKIMSEKARKMQLQAQKAMQQKK
jgi:hypothetical protein